MVGHVLVLAAALTCLRLGWWQWGVSQGGHGTAQNLGYALLWPVFSGSFIYMWLRFLHLEAVRDAEEEQAVAELAGMLDESDAVGEWSVADPRSVRVDGADLDGGCRDGARVSGIGDGECVADDAPIGVESSSSDGLASTARVGDGRRAGDGDVDAASDTESAVPISEAAKRRRRHPAGAREVYTVSVATVGDDEDDPELAAYNRALAALAEQDERRAR